MICDLLLGSIDQTPGLFLEGNTTTACTYSKLELERLKKCEAGVCINPRTD